MVLEGFICEHCKVFTWMMDITCRKNFVFEKGFVLNSNTPFSYNT